MTGIKSQLYGFTLLELLITLAIIGILITLAQAGFSSLLSKQRAQSASAKFFCDLQFARSEAIKRNQLVGVCPSDDTKHCTNDWSKGYMVFTIDKQTLPPSISDILRSDRFDHSLTIKNTNHPLVTFSGDGRCLDRTTFHLSGSGSPLQKIVIYDSGRARIESFS